jgi:hypothetical protein
MVSNNSYNRYRQYRKNRRRYEASVGAVPAIILLVVLANILPILNWLFICIIAGIVIYILYQLYRSHHPRSIKVELDNLDENTFEKYCIKLFGLNDFVNVRSAKANSNKGIDIIAEKSRKSYGIKCVLANKDTNVDADSIRQAISGSKYFCCDNVAIITNRDFTLNAKSLAQKENIILWNRQELIKFLGNDEQATVQKD